MVVIPAHGRGLRLSDVTGGDPKTLLEVGGEPILARLLHAVATVPNVRVVVTAQPEDILIRKLLERERLGVGAYAAVHPLRVRVELRRQAPHGYLNDLLALSEELGDEFSVLDADLVVRHGDLCAFLETADRQSGDFLIGCAAHPPSTDPRSIRIVVDANGDSRLASGEESALPRSVGAYHWRPSTLAHARAFVGRTGGSFHELLEDVVGTALRIAIVPFRAAINVNTRAELELADGIVRAWAQEQSAAEAVRASPSATDTPPSRGVTTRARGGEAFIASKG